MTRHPEVLWAQRSSSSSPEKNVIFLTVNLPDIDESSLTYTLTSTRISCNASTGAEQTKFEFDLELFAEVDPEQSTRRLTSRSLFAVLRKKEAKLEYWPRLTKEKLKNAFIKTDFSKWADEDEQDGNPESNDDFGVGGIPGMGDGMSAMSGMSGMEGGMGSMEGGMGGMGGMGGGMDFEKMMADLGKGSGAGAKADEVTESDSDEDGPPPLEDAEPAK